MSVTKPKRRMESLLLPQSDWAIIEQGLMAAVVSNASGINDPELSSTQRERLMHDNRVLIGFIAKLPKARA